MAIHVTEDNTHWITLGRYSFPQSRQKYNPQIIIPWFLICGIEENSLSERPYVNPVGSGRGVWRTLEHIWTLRRGDDVSEAAQSLRHEGYQLGIQCSWHLCPLMSFSVSSRLLSLSPRSSFAFFLALTPPLSYPLSEFYPMYKNVIRLRAVEN